MTLDEVTKGAIDPAMALLPESLDSPEARLLMLAIGLQESEFEYRVQKGDGPAHGLWQFEKGGGVKGVCTHPASRLSMMKLCNELDVEFDYTAIWQELAKNDVLAAGAARLLLYTDPMPLPSAYHGTTAWSYYDRLWRPGKPRPRDWIGNYAAATKYLGF